MTEADLETLQYEIAARIESDPYFAEVPVLVRRKGVVDSDIENALGVVNSRSGKAGAVIVVMMPSVDAPNNDAPGPQIDFLPVARCIEKPLLNRGPNGTNLSAEQLALRLLRLLHLWRCDAIGETIRIDKNPVRPATLADPKAVGYDVFSQCTGSFDGSRTTEVKITAHAGFVTLVCNTPGAAIYYTTDGSYPHLGNPDAVLYSIPFEAASDTLVRAGAYTTDRLPSSVTRLILS